MWWLRSNPPPWRVILHRDHALYGAHQTPDASDAPTQQEVRADAPVTALHAALAQIPPQSAIELILGSDVAHCWLLQGAGRLTEHDWQLLARAKNPQGGAENLTHILETHSSSRAGSDAVHRLVLSLDRTLIEALRGIRARIRWLAYANLDRLGVFASHNSVRPLASATRDAAMWTALIVDSSGPASLAHYPATAPANAIEKELQRALVSLNSETTAALWIQDTVPDVSTEFAETGFAFDLLGVKARRERHAFWGAMLLFLGVVVTASVLRYRLDQGNARLQKLAREQQTLAADLVPKTANVAPSDLLTIENGLSRLEALVKETPGLNLEHFSFQAADGRIEVELTLSGQPRAGLSETLGKINTQEADIESVDRIDDASQGPSWRIRASVLVGDHK